MSKAKRTVRIVGIPDVPTTQTTIPGGPPLSAYAAGATPLAAAGDPLSQIVRIEAEETVREYREAMTASQIKKLRERTQRLKEETGSEDTPDGGVNVRGMFNFSSADLSAIAAMPPEERAKFLETVKEISVMASMSAGGKPNPIMQLAMMGGFGRGQQQGLTAKDVIELQTNLNQIYQSSGGNRDMSQQLLLKLMTETVPAWQNQSIQNMKYVYDTRIKDLEEQRSDPMRDIRNLKELAHELGYTSAAQDKEVALARMQMEDRWKVAEFQQRKEEAAMARQLGIVEQILKNVNVPDLIKTATRQQVSEQLHVQAPPAEAPAVPAAEGEPLVLYKCLHCNGPDGKPTEIWAPKSQTRVTCQGCGSSFSVVPGSVKQQ